MASLVLGILSVLGGILTGLPAIVCGIVGISKIGNSSGRLTGKGLAVAGIATGGFGIMFTAVLAAIAIPAYVKVVEKAKLAQSQQRARVIVLACQLYAADHDGNLPVDVMTLLDESYIEKGTDLRSPFAEAGGSAIGYKFLISGNLADFPQPGQTVLLHDEVQAPGGQMVMAFLDGHVAVGRVAGKIARPE